MEIVVQPKIPNDPPLAELSELVRLLSGIDDGVEARVAPGAPLVGPAVTWDQIIHVWIPWHDIAAGVAGGVTTKVVEWLLAKKAQDSPRRPRRVLLFGPDGLPLATVEDDGVGDAPRVASAASTRKLPPPQ